MFVNMKNFLKLFKKKRVEQVPPPVEEKKIYDCSTITSRRVLVEEDIQYGEYARNAIQHSIFMTAKEFITFTEEKDPIDGSVTIIGKLHVCNIEEDGNRS